MFFLRNNLNKMLKNKRVYSGLNNGCNFDFETKKKLQLMFIMTPSLYVLTICNFILTAASILKK